MTLRISMMAVALAMLAGCQTAEPVSEVENQAQILAAVPINYRQEVPIFLRGSLDPSTIANAEITQPMLGSIGSADGTQAPLVCVRLTQSSAPGDFAAGPRTIALVFRDGRIVNRLDDNAACSGAAYGPFPEIRASV